MILPGDRPKTDPLPHLANPLPLGDYVSAQCGCLSPTGVRAGETQWPYPFSEKPSRRHAP